MQEPAEWEKRNIVFYLKYLLKKKHKRLFFENEFKFNFEHHPPTLEITVKTARKRDFAQIAIEHKILRIDYHHHKTDAQYYYYKIIINDTDSLKQLLNGTRLFICEILNEHCLHIQMRPWSKAPSSTIDKEIYFYCPQQPAPAQESELEKEQRKKLIAEAGAKVWRFLTGEPVKNSVKNCDKSLVDGSLSHERVEGVGLLLKLTRPNLEKLHHLAITAIHEKQKPLPLKSPTSEMKLHLSDEEEEPKHARITDEPPKVHHFTISSLPTLFKPASVSVKQSPASPAIKAPAAPIPKSPSPLFMPPAPIAKTPAPAAAKSSGSNPSLSAKRPYSMLDVPAKEKPYVLAKIDEILGERDKRKAQELKRQNRGEDEKCPVLNFTEKQVPK